MFITAPLAADEHLRHHETAPYINWFNTSPFSPDEYSNIAICLECFYWNFYLHLTRFKIHQIIYMYIFCRSTHGRKEETVCKEEFVRHGECFNNYVIFCYSCVFSIIIVFIGECCVEKTLNYAREHYFR